MKKTNKKGFTIVELVIVIAVIAILAGVLIPTFTSVATNAKKSAALQEARNAYTAAYADALADDGYITEADDADDVTAGIQIANGDFVFTVTTAGKLEEIDYNGTKHADRTFTVAADGTINVA